MDSLTPRERLRRHWPYLTALVVPLVIWLVLKAFPLLDVKYLAGQFHVVVMTLVSLCALAVAVLAGRASTKVRQPSVVLLAAGCLGTGFLLLGHGLTTPFVLGNPLNQWVGRLPYAAIGLFALCMALAASGLTRLRPFRVVGDRPLATLITVGGASAALTLYVSLDPTRLGGTEPWAIESTVRWSIVAGTVCLLLPVSWVHWRRFRLSLDIVHMSLSIAAVMVTASVISMHFGELWRLSWWDYHGCLLAGFAGVSYAVLKRWSATRTAASVLEHAFEDDPVRLIQRSYPTPLRQLVETMEARDSYTHGHSARTAELAVAIGIRLGLHSDGLRTLAQGAYLHDIGKLGIDDKILNKPARLTDEERTVIESHPTLGVHIASTHPVLSPCLPIIRHHHERFDGDGYPDGLRAGNIPLLARIAAVADVWDALTTDRAYRPGWEPQRALDHMVDGAGRHLDPTIVAVLLELAAEAGFRPSGVGGDLSELETATQICHDPGTNDSTLTAPLRRLITDTTIY